MDTIKKCDCVYVYVHVHMSVLLILINLVASPALDLTFDRITPKFSL